MNDAFLMEDSVDAVVKSLRKGIIAILNFPFFPFDHFLGVALMVSIDQL